MDTEKIYIYASRPHEHFEIYFTPKLSSQQHVKYGNNLMNISYKLLIFFGGVPRNCILNPECHEDLIKT